MLRVNGDDLPTAPLGHSDGLIIGEWAVAIGNPFGNLFANSEPSVTAGVISAVGRHIVPEAVEQASARLRIGRAYAKLLARAKTEPAVAALLEDTPGGRYPRLLWRDFAHPMRAELARIPIAAQIESLNVSNAAAIAFYEVARGSLPLR